MNSRPRLRRWLAATAALTSAALLLSAAPANAETPEPAAADRPLFDTGPAQDAIRRLVGTSHGSQITLATIPASEGREPTSGSNSAVTARASPRWSASTTR